MANIFRPNNDKIPLTKAEIRKGIADLPDPTEGPQYGANGEIEDHPLTMIKALEDKGISTDTGTIMNLLTPEETEALLKMIKHHEFNQKESAFLKYLIQTSGRNLEANLDDCAVLYNELSPKRRGKKDPPATQFMKGKLEEILSEVFRVKGPKYGLKLKAGKTGKDIIDFMKLNKKVQTVIKKEQKKKEQESKKAQREAMKEFWTSWKELNKTRREHGLSYKGASDLQHDIDTYLNPDGTRGLKSRGEKVQLPLRSVNYHGGSDAIDRMEGRYENK